jgi:hypothetical protein
MNGGKVSSFLLTTALTISIAPFTSLMIPTNFEIIEINKAKGSARSTKVSETRARTGNLVKEGRVKSAEESVEGKGDVDELTDLSGLQEKTTVKTTGEEEEKARQLLEKCKRLNGVRAVLMGAGSIVELLTALT